MEKIIATHLATQYITYVICNETVKKKRVSNVNIRMEVETVKFGNEETPRVDVEDLSTYVSKL